MEELITRLAKATGADSELERDITAALWPGEPLQWPPQYKATSEFWSRRRVEQYTSSLDAALTLVPDGAEFEIGSANLLGEFWAVVIHGETEFKGIQTKTPAIALCIAALKAHTPHRAA